MGWFTEKKIGILDPEGLERNPLTGKKGYSDTYKYFSDKWSNYPVYLSGAERLINIIRDNRVMVFESGTGSGKTVLIPKFALHAVNYKGRVIVTVPKSILANSHAHFAALLMDATIGKEIGFKHRNSKLTEEEAEVTGSTASVTEESKLIFATGGTLVQILNKNPSLDDYSVVIIDEAHERGSDVDETLLFMREALKINKNLKLIVMSATLPNRDLFLDYFEEFNPYHETLSSKSNYPVKMFWSDKDYVKSKDTIDESINILFNKVMKKEGDVLIFVTSKPNGEKIEMEIKKRDPTIFTGILDKNTGGEEKDLITNEHLYKEHDSRERRKPLGGWSRKVVMGTNVAESSVTIDGLMFVIDNGMELKSDFDPDRQKEILKTQLITQAQATQRKGRTGRTGPGNCYTLYTKQTFDDMEPSQKVAILSQDMTTTFLDYLTSPRIKDLLDLVRFVGNLIEHPTKENTLASIRNLLSLNLISHFDVHGSGKLTDEGKMVATLMKDGKLDDIYIAKSLMVSRYFHCEEVVIVIAAALSHPSVNGPVNGLFMSAYGNKKKDREESIRYFQHPYGDLFSMYKIVTRYSDAATRLDKYNLTKWCKNHFLNERVLREIRSNFQEIYKKTRRSLSKIEQMTDEYYFKTCEEAALFSLLKGYFPNLCKREGKSDMYKNFYPKKKTKASFDSRYGDSFFAFLPKSKLPIYMFYVKNFSLDKNNTFQFCNAVPKEMVKLLKPQELSTLEELKI